MKTVLVFEHEILAHGQRLYEPQIPDPDRDVTLIYERFLSKVVKLIEVRVKINAKSGEIGTYIPCIHTGTLSPYTVP